MKKIFKITVILLLFVFILAGCDLEISVKNPDTPKPSVGVSSSSDNNNLSSDSNGNSLADNEDAGSDQTGTKPDTGSSSTTVKPDIGSTPTPKPDEKFEDYGLPVMDVDLSKITISKNGIYNTVKEVGAYIHTFKNLPSNYKKKNEFNKSDYTKANKLSVGGDRFYNREGLLPEKSGRIYYECDIDYTGGGRNAKRIVFSSDNLVFYTDTHYDSFYILRFYGNVNIA